MGLSETVRNGLMDHFFGKSSYTPPSDYYVALIRSDGQEPSGGDYARVQTDSDDWNAASVGVNENAVTVTFPTPTGTWGSITKVKLFDAASGGTELGVGDLAYPRDVTAISPAPEFPPGDIRVGMPA